MAKPKATPPKPVRVTIRGKEFNFGEVVPMKAGDWTALKRQGVKLGPNNNLLEDPDAMVAFVLWFAQKIAGDVISRDDILELPIAKVMQIVRYIHEASNADEDDEKN
jgi:hypothetical protein